MPGLKSKRNAVGDFASEHKLNVITPPQMTGEKQLSMEELLAMFRARPSQDPLSFAFDRKFAVHPGMGGVPPIQGEAILPAWERLLGSRGKKPLSLYAHIPFCQSRCLYCGFSGLPTDKDVLERYVRCLKAEIAYLARQEAARSPVQTIYLGGGTPTCLEPEQAGEILDLIKSRFTLCNDCEITLEGRVHDLSPERAEAFVAAGFNRFSVGIQSFDTETRRRIGRQSTREEAMRNLSALAGMGRAVTVIDLIFGLPGQSVGSMLSDIEACEELRLDGLDLYQLNVFSDSPLQKAADSGKIPPIAALSQQGAFYRDGSDLLGRLRWRQLTLSHFARTFRERNLYNVMSKKRTDCLAAGAGSGGYLDGWSLYRLPRPLEYMDRAEKGLFAPDMLAPPRPGQEMIGVISEQMEQGYLNQASLVESYSLVPGPIEAILEDWDRNRLMTVEGPRSDMTVSGRFWGVNLTEAVTKIATGCLRPGS
jgi:oxygen-independent coproporphyrinogen-3 oxidase